MKRGGAVSLIAGSLLVVSLAGTVLSLRRADQVRERATLEEVLFISSPQAVKRMSLGYSGLLADIYWTRAVQYFGGRRVQGENTYKLLAPLLRITTALDPQLMVAYEFGSSFLTAKPPYGAGSPAEAAALVQEGIRQNPDNWHLYYDLGFINYLDIKDYNAAAEAFARGSELPNAHPFMKVFAARAAQEGGEADMARMLWTTTYQTTKDNDIKANAAAHLRALRVDQEVMALQPIVEQYREKTGHYPTSFVEIARAGMIAGIPVDPLRHPYQISSTGDVMVRDPEDLPFIRKGLPLGYMPPAKVKLLPAD